MSKHKSKQHSLGRTIGSFSKGLVIGEAKNDVRFISDGLRGLKRRRNK